MLVSYQFLSFHLLIPPSFCFVRSGASAISKAIWSPENGIRWVVFTLTCCTRTVRPTHLSTASSSVTHIIVCGNQRIVNSSILARLATQSKDCSKVLSLTDWAATDYATDAHQPPLSHPLGYAGRSCETSPPAHQSPGPSLYSPIVQMCSWLHSEIFFNPRFCNASSLPPVMTFSPLSYISTPKKIQFAPKIVFFFSIVHVLAQCSDITLADF